MVEIKTRKTANKPRAANVPVTTIVVYSAKGLNVKTFLCSKNK